jgi:hypothetical protein
VRRFELVEDAKAKRLVVPLPLRERVADGVVVAIPRSPAKYAFPVVVAPPLMVRPPVAVPLPMVEEAETMMPFVVVGLSASPAEVRFQLLTPSPVATTVDQRVDVPVDMRY